MSTSTVPGGILDYLAELDRASRGLPRHDRQDLRARVWSEVAEVAGPDALPDRIATALAGLGPPAALAGPPLRDPVVVHLLGSSFLTLGVGGVAGLVRVWRSPTWPRRDAVLATVLVLACGGAAALAPVHPVAGVLLGLLGLGPFGAALWLGAVMLLARRRARRRHPAEPRDASAAPDTSRGGGRSAPYGRCDAPRR